MAARRFLIGLTGGIGSGKSTVADRLVAVHGMRLVDADVVAREVVEPGTPAHAAIVERFGRDILAADGRLDRPALARVVLGDDAARADLTVIVHPAVREATAAQVAELGQDGVPVVLAVPLLVEAGIPRDYDAIVVVATHPATQARRLVADRGMDPDEAWARIRAQAPLDAKLAVATHVIWNEGTLEELHARVDAVAEELWAAARAG